MQRINAPSRVPEGYALFIDCVDDLGRHWKFKVAPDKGPGGTIGYFNSLSELDRWKRQVEEVRRMLEGKSTVIEQIYDAYISCNISQQFFDSLMNRITR